MHGRKLKISKILNFRNFNFKTCKMPTEIDTFKFKWLNVSRLPENESEKLV